MASAAQPPAKQNTRNHHQKCSKNTVPVNGISVEFPYQPYGSQLAFMSRVISTLDRAQKGHCHALLESPTGTGKSLSLLCSALAWQKHAMSKDVYGNLSHSKADPEASTDPLEHGGGFIPDLEPSGNLEPALSVANGTAKNKKKAPTIFYSSRTHSQITQAINEYRKTTYRVPMAVLASRKHYCTNAHLRGRDDIDEQCKLLLKNQEVGMGCPEFKNMHKVKGHPSLQKGGCHEAHDIEDLVKVGQVVKGCSYFAARSMADDAQLVFCPYSYIINPVIRRAMDVDIKGAIVILDEAHNIEDIARDAGSVDVEEDTLLQLQTELGPLSQGNPMTYQPLHEMIGDILCWIGRRKNNLEKREFQHYFSSWTGDRALRELQEANISLQCFQILQECATKAIKAASDAAPEVAHLSGMSASTLEGLFSSLNYFFSGNGLHIFDYLLVLQRCVKRVAGNAAGGWTHTLSLWCLNPAVVFRDIAHLSMSVILSSGTLSPMSSFSSELGVQFGTCLEAPHVIDTELQLWAAVISCGPGNYPLNASYRTADAYAFQDALGITLEEICKVVTGGCLIFFPSYKLMEKLCSRWRETGQWPRLNARKRFFVEPRGGSQDDFEPVLKGYYNSIHQGTKPINARNAVGKKLETNNCTTKKCSGNIKKEGAAFLAVCRGKVSEGIDFSDDNARVVIIVGIPFPNINDVKVAEKKKFNDTYKSTKNLLSGSEWYCQQAFRALNQAAGRCIRHRFDYGAIIFLDERYCDDRNTNYISKWLRKSIRQYDNFDKSMEGLKSFFNEVKDQVSKRSCIVKNTNAGIEINPSMNQSKGSKYQKGNKSNFCGQKVKSESVLETEKVPQFCQSLPFLTKYDSCCPQIKSEAKISVFRHSETSSCTDYIDLKSNCEEDTRPSWAHSMPPSPDDLELSIVNETPCMNGSVPVSTPESFSKNEYSSMTVVQTSTKIPEQLCCLLTIPKSDIIPSTSVSSLVTSPERNADGDSNSIMPDTESSFNLSVNSHTRKRKKSFNSLSVNQLHTEEFDATDTKAQGGMDFMACSLTADKNCSFPGNMTENSSVQPHATNSDNFSSGLLMDKRLQIFCSVCNNPLGLPQNNLYVRCSLTSSTKYHLASLHKGLHKDLNNATSTNVPVLISDVSSVDQRLCSRALDCAPEQGIWCKEDGCVFNAVFCPFCSDLNCLGVQIMAADASNIHLISKILLFLDCLKIKNFAPSDKGTLPSCGVGKSAFFNAIEKFSYVPQHQNPGRWRTTKSKMQLPKRALIPNSEG